jgi:hypothetical protein
MPPSIELREAGGYRERSNSEPLEELEGRWR